MSDKDIKFKYFSYLTEFLSRLIVKLKFKHAGEKDYEISRA
jgi:hypothetical protein